MLKTTIRQHEANTKKSQKIQKLFNEKKRKICSRVFTSEGFLQNNRNFYLTVFEIQRGTDGRRTKYHIGPVS